MKLALIGNYGATNVGDEAILSAILASHPDHEWTVFSANPAETGKVHGAKAAPQFPLGVRTLLKRGFKPSIAALRLCEAVVLGGGGLFQDNRLFACFLWAWQVWWAKKLGKPLFVYANGVGPLRTRVGKWLARAVFSYASGVTVRDAESRRVLHELGIDPRKIEVTADPAFLFGGPEVEMARQPHTYVVSLRPWSSMDRRTVNVFTEVLLKLKAEKSAEFTFVGMQEIHEHDRQLLDPLVKRVGGKIVAPGDFGELVGLLSEAEFAIGMRFHFLAAALVAGVPTLAVSYSPKIDSLFSGDLAPYLLQLEELSPEAVERRLSRLSVEYNTFKAFAKSRLAHLREAAALNPVFLEDFLRKLSDSAGAPLTPVPSNDLTPPDETDKVSQHPSG